MLVLALVSIGVRLRTEQPDSVADAVSIYVLRVNVWWWVVSVVVTFLFVTALSMALRRLSDHPPRYKHGIVAILAFLSPILAQVVVALLCTLIAVRPPSDPLSFVCVLPSPFLLWGPCFLVLLFGGIQLGRLKRGGA